MLSLPTTVGGGGSPSSRHQHHGACPLSLLYHHECACLSPLLHQINANLIRHAPSPTMTKVNTVLPVHATNPRSTNGRGPRCMHLTLSPTLRMCIPPFTYGASCLSSDSTYPITQSSPWRMPLILTLPHYHKRRACPHLFTIKLHAHNLQSTSATVHALHFHCLPRHTQASPHPPHIAKVHDSHPLSTNTDMSALYPPRRMPLILIQSWSMPVLIFTQFLRVSRCTAVAGATVTVWKL